MHSSKTNLERLIQTFDNGNTVVADRNFIPRATAVAAAEYLDVPYENAMTAMQICEVILGHHDLPATVSGLRTAEHYAKEIIKLVEEADAASDAKPIQSKTPGEINQRLGKNQPAKTKLEAVQRISAISASGSQSLGPGSKERKSVLTNLGEYFNFNISPSLSKIDYFISLVNHLHGTPANSDFSTGQTITLVGLNKLLSLASPDLGPAEAQMAADMEAYSYLGAIASSLKLANPDTQSNQNWVQHAIDGRQAVSEMFNAEYENRKQTEWFGWYVEFCGIPELKKHFGGEPVKIGNTTFDYQGIRTWDLKAHTAFNNIVPLNDKQSIFEAVEMNGLGFLIVQGTPSFEGEPEFYKWHLGMRGKDPNAKRSPGSRRLKVSVTPTSLDAYYFQDKTSLESAIEEKIIRDFEQGRQQSGAERKVKLKMDLDKANSSQYHIASVKIPK